MGEGRRRKNKNLATNCIKNRKMRGEPPLSTCDNFLIRDHIPYFILGTCTLFHNNINIIIIK